MNSKHNTIGQPLPRRDACQKVTGQALFPADLNLPGQLYLAVRFSDKPHARFKLNLDEAQAVPGVVRIFTAEDVPNNAYGLNEPDQPVLAEGYVRCLMDRVALVAAETEAQARRAVAAIRVIYEELPVLDNVEAARARGAPQLHPHHPGNLQEEVHFQRGDLEAGFRQAKVIVEGEYQTPSQEHAYLQAEAGVAFLDDFERVVVRTAGQWVQDDQRQIVAALGLTPEQVRVEYVYTGGAFGGKEDINLQILLALAAWKLKRPVKMTWTREESIRGHHKRHPIKFKTRWGATAEGKICAVETELLLDGGAYASSSRHVLQIATLLASGPYEVPNVKLDGYLYLTNNLVNGACRGFGAVQSAFCYEMQMEKLAEALGLDPVEFRMRNLYREGSRQPSGDTIPAGVGAAEALETVARAAGWTKKPDKGWQRPVISQPSDSSRQRGLAVTCAFKNIGYSFGFPERSCAEVEISGGSGIERVIVRHSAAEVGQGIHTALGQIVAEVLNVPVDIIEVENLIGSDDPLSGSCSASRLAFMAGNAAKGAAEKARELWLGEHKPPVKAFHEYRATVTTAPDPQTGDCVPNFSYGYCAVAAEIETDLETGQIKIIRLISANDVGKALNPQIVEGQIQGGLAMGLGWALTEDFKMVGGVPLTRNLSEYLIPTALDVPPLEIYLLEKADPNGPFGARGVGEMGILAVAPAITLALYRATGCWFNTFPLTPEQVLLNC